MPRAVEDGPKKETVVTTITVKQSLHQRVKIKAVKDNRSASSIYEEATELYLKNGK